MMHSETCPLCAGDLGAPHQIDLCTKCYSGLQLSGAVPVTTTGEFQAVMGSDLDGLGLPGEDEHCHGVSCCWCSKEVTSVRKMLSSGKYHICNECVFLCADILRMELGDDFS